MIAVTGADGQLGTAFRQLLANDAHCLTRSELDLTEPESIRSTLEGLRPSVLINCAAYTDVDRAESEPLLAEAVNATAVGIMAEVMANLGGRFVTFSTDYVFDGTVDRPYVESDPTRPINTYGKTKRDGEVATLRTHPEALIIRTSWVLSGTHSNFASTMIQRARAGEVTVVNDQYGHPTLVDDLAAATLSALETGATGIVHLANAGVTTWYGLAREIVEIAGLPPDRIRPCTTSEYPTDARRPANSLLNSERLAELGMQPLPPYQPGLRQIVAETLDRMP